MITGMANAYTDKRTIVKLPSTSRKRCPCGCKTRSTHMGAANDMGMISGCELRVRRWVKQGPDSISRSYSQLTKKGTR